ncbi:MAG: D-lyxose/D-mannose family sugar isomerase [Promethearchaeota archaeon]
MRRSEINQIMKNALEFTRKHQFLLPPFAYWKSEDWKSKGQEISEIINNALGWDITDFGSGNFNDVGLTVFTLRNGLFGDTSSGAKPYCEKLLIVREGQVTPFHHHNSKVEDIINRGGGILQVQLFKVNKEDAGGRGRGNGGEIEGRGEISDDEFEVSMDGVIHVIQPGTIVDIHPGESITLTQEHCHKFWGKVGHGPVLVGEVSSVNDDYVDNVFYDGVPRFSRIEEDEEPLHLLYDDYKNYVSLTTKIKK